MRDVPATRRACRRDHGARSSRLLVLSVTALVAALCLVATAFPAGAQEAGTPLAPLHPEVVLRDAAGLPAAVSGAPVDGRASCGECHDVDFIREHATHTADDLAPWPWPSVPRSGWVPGPPAEAEGGDPDCLQCHLPEGAGLPARARDADCATCHGMPATEPRLPTPEARPSEDGPGATPLTGQVYAPGRLSRSGFNLPDKRTLTRSWDVHAERLVSCANCHSSSNNPLHRRPDADLQVEGLLLDPRSMAPGAWLQRPSHVLAGSGDEAAAALSCTTCHDPAPTHRWLPYAERHQQALSCESCHTPVLYGPAVESVDWTRLDERGQPTVTWRGCDGPCTDDPTAPVTGFEPTLLPVNGPDGRSRLAPHTLVTSWYWADAEGAPVPPELLAEAGIASLTRDAAARALSEAGVRAPAVAGRVDALPVHHGTTSGEWALRGCESCHDQDSRLAGITRVADSLVAGVTPVWGASDDGPRGGRLIRLDDGGLAFQSDPGEAGLHVLGHRRVSWANRTGILALLATLVLVALHGGRRWWLARGRRRAGGGAHPAPGPHASGAPVYMYSGYERLWHWLQAAAITALLGTGLEIHMGAPGWVSFAVAVKVHNVLGFLVTANAALAAFYHLASGEIRQYVPEPRGFFSQAVVQARYYLGGIFRGEPHPFEKSPGRKLNPLQQLTYLGILNVLLPLQVITGMAMWGAQRWPAVDGVLGGLTVLAPLHALAAWLFAAFLLIHVYLTTTGPTPTAHIRAMVAGWEGAEGPATGEPVS